MKKFYIETYGCQMNVHESEKLAGILADNGYKVCDNAVDADIVGLVIEQFVSALYI